MPANTRRNLASPRTLALAAFIACICLATTGVAAPPQQASSPSAASPSASELPQLVDITPSTGIKFEHLSSPEQKYIVESMGGGVALIDYDRDGWPDLYFTNAQSVEMALAGKKSSGALYHNNHDGTFTDVTAKAGVGQPCWAQGVAVGDYNNDGWPDLLVTCFGGVVLYRNNGDGTFTDVTKQAGLASDTMWATGATFGDYDGDGFVDLFVSHYVALSLKDLPEFGSSPTCKYRGIAVQCGPRGLKGSPSSLYHNNGDGTFTDVSKTSGIRDSPEAFGLTSVFSHFDDATLPDLWVANDAGRNYLYRNDGAGHFKEIGFEAGVAVNQDGAEQANMGVALGDYQNVGRTSAAITHFSDEYTALYRNDGKLDFTDVSYVASIAQPTTAYVGWGDSFFDFDNDGWLDFIMVNGHVYPQVDSLPTGARYREPALLFLNQRNGSFKNISTQVGPAFQVSRVSRGLAVGDLFNDGRLDVVIENLTGGPLVLRSEGGVTNHWLSLELAGTTTNRLAINARVRVTAGDLTPSREVLSGGSYISQSDLRLHFGLGAHDHADKIEIAWPNGKSEVLTDVAADHFYGVKQGEGIVPLEKVRPVPAKK
ncbi:MAG: CRTAC1 family protein [Candidatus Acidiferrales bacterium]